MSQQRLTERGHMHVEAFCLMWYACKTCGHRERIWNSRDGVTPFCLGCPSCGEPSLTHSDWNLDLYSPFHQPARGQRKWVAMTMVAAIALAKRMLARRYSPEEIMVSSVSELALSIYEEGRAPNLAVHGYAEETE